MDDLARTNILDTLASQYGIRILNPGRWELTHLQRVLKAVKDLAELMGDFARFQSEIRGVCISRYHRKTRLAAMTLPVIGVTYFESASWGDENEDKRELKWQTVHELAHLWDIRKLFRLSCGVKRATSSKYGKFTGQLPMLLEYEPGGKWLKCRGKPLNALEDWADSVGTYVYSDYAESLPNPRLISTIRWNYVSEHMHIKLPYPADWDSRFDEPEISGETPSDR